MVLQCRWWITAAIVTRGVKGEREGEEGIKEKEEELEQAKKDTLSWHTDHLNFIKQDCLAKFHIQFLPSDSN